MPLDKDKTHYVKRTLTAPKTLGEYTVTVTAKSRSGVTTTEKRKFMVE